MSVRLRRTRTWLSSALTLVAGIAALSGVALADPVKVYAAGSLVAPLKELIAASGLPAGSVADPVFGPAGLLAHRLETGETADLFLSANLAGPRRLAGQGRVKAVIPFAENRLCVVSRKSLGLRPEGLLDRLLAASLRLATSTPEADPGGDYAWAMFDRADKLHPGAAATLKGKAQKLLGSPNAMVPVAGHSPAASIFLADKADALVYYCSGQAEVLREVPDLVSTPLPADLDVHAVYGLGVLSDDPAAQRLALFILSDRGQAIIARHGMIPIAGSDATP